jgi:hypothetical protein
MKDFMFNMFKLNEQHKIAFFNLRVGGESFLYDFATNTKITFADDEKAYEILDISPCGELVITTSTNFKRLFRVTNIKTKEVVFETKEFYVYDALFTPVPNLFVLRADIRTSCKAFIFNTLTNEIVYKFPASTGDDARNCLEYGDVNFGCNTFALPAKKKGEITLFDFVKSQATILKLPTDVVIHRIRQLDDRYLLVVDADFNVMKIDIRNLKSAVWKTKLKQQSLCYAPLFFVHENLVVFTNFYFLELNNGAFREMPCTLRNGGLDYKYFGDCFMSMNGNIANLKTMEVTNLRMTNCEI